MLMAVKQVDHFNTGSSKVPLVKLSYIQPHPLIYPQLHHTLQRLASLMKEIELLRELTHPNIVGYYGVQQDGDVTSVFLEYVPGGSISDLLKRFGSFEEVVFLNDFSHR